MATSDATRGCSSLMSACDGRRYELEAAKAIVAAVLAASD
jgi:hypothetical protein